MCPNYLLNQSVLKYLMQGNKNVNEIHDEKNAFSYKLHNPQASKLLTNKLTHHWSFATAAHRAGLQPENVSAPRSESFHREDPPGGSGV